MPRTARDIIADTPYHVIHRGNNRQNIFFCEADYKYFLKLLHEAKVKYPCKIYSYVLMPNHFHLLLESVQHSENLAKFVKLAAQKYAQHVNKIRKRTGTLWEGRFKSSPISRDSYLLACTRYIELNAVRAKIVRDPAGYKWSSYGLKIGDADNYHILDRDSLYIEMGKEDGQRQANYKKWIKDSVPEGEWDSIRRAVNRCGIFGSAQFKESLERMLSRSFDIRGRGRPRKNKK